ncbi:conserved Plasmodium protein, unknown function [Plasmodium knowlesi strain H]|uniref:Dolichyl-diphosphooligosaccharide-protein glycosyltransferase subunit OST5 n=3 Tax=Plasmodium knowlesi TaxID=5850 RepID=A0A5K1V565_PLAKH|nr:dolichyl-diphosphooligosaccharide--protein glycosyltransferase subunit OST5, putative [Plasmodium knowlesi strain H]OTN63970.1 Uncharacterized protein PKNOH_S140281200 [Plasmodium knowlesi]CAA9991222.1 dolichyl-diphosphooligosaccharide--protein glycosyltransferase subunit OST5, putative [Plasmodium knowlesi strain H]SBO26290.1 conserved Plasmodium protein, unknown function [Plasmodium knowlesi strain H]SBO29577.1 conserved Plasmodium protein, unknown function [Plasmodium knowlesi strain H]V|eukprot:XP_002262504.1 hypothetical protein, conserved in Plasmodium species [Plasmodium knowlesi strain H]
MVTSTDVNIELEPYQSVLKRKYIPYLLFLFHIFAFVSVIFLFDRICEHRNKRSVKFDLLLCLITSISVGMALYVLLLYFNVCL